MAALGSSALVAAAQAESPGKPEVAGASAGLLAWGSVAW